MINKQGLWFLTLLSLILVLSVYYITMPNDILSNNSNIEVEKTKDEKNTAYEQIKYINELTAMESTIEKQIKKEYNLDSFVKVENTKIKVVVLKEEHDVSLANSIMKLVQSNFDEKRSITIQFEK